MPKLSRTPPLDVRNQLRAEVGFGCPIDNCGSPYLQYHHFDPEWHVENHHRPEGMIAICAAHHGLAGAWTAEQVRGFKKIKSRENVGARLQWSRREMIAVVGSNYFYETLRIFEYQGQPVVWFTRNDRRELLLNISLSMISGEPRVEMRNNDWIALGDPCDIDCKPGGKFLHIEYDNGDFLRVQFKEWVSEEVLIREHPAAEANRSALTFPIVTVDVTLCVKNASVAFDSRESQIEGVRLTNCWFERNECGISIR